jgi:hypothetical protein
MTILNHTALPQSVTRQYILEQHLHEQSFVAKTPNVCGPNAQDSVPQFIWPPWARNTKVGSIPVLLASCLTGLESAVRQLTIFAFICKTD